MKLSFFLALRIIMRSDKGSIVLTALILLVVFLNLLFVDAIFAGITKTMDDGKIDYQYGEVIIEPEDGKRYIKDAVHVVDALRDFSYVRDITARIATGAVVSFDKNDDGRNIARLRTLIVGIDPKTDNYAIDIASHVIEGRYLRNTDRGKILLGADAAGGYTSSVFADDLEGVRTGDVVTVVFENGIVKDFDVIGIYRTKNFEVDARALIVRDDFNAIFGTTNEASEIIVRLNDRSQSRQAMADARALGFDRYEISDWNDKLSFGRTINESFAKVNTILRVIGSIVAGLVIFIVIFVDIVNRRKQIGILKAIGIPDRTIIYSYVIRGMFYTVIGIVFGYLLMRYGVVTFFQAHPIDFPMGWMVPLIKERALRSGIILFTLAGLIGSLVPAFKEVRKRILSLMH